MYDNARWQIGIRLRRISSKRISNPVNRAHISHRTNLSGTSSISACSWIFALILCCLPGLSLYEPSPTARAMQDAAASPLGQVQSSNTQAIVNTHDGALTSSLRSSPHTDTSDPSDPALAVTPLPALCNLRAPVSGQGYDAECLCRASSHAAAPYSPRSPPVLA